VYEGDWAKSVFLMQTALLNEADKFDASSGEEVDPNEQVNCNALCDISTVSNTVTI